MEVCAGWPGPRIRAPSTRFTPLIARARAICPCARKGCVFKRGPNPAPARLPSRAGTAGAKC
eukprot:6012242-Prymnesium_polylepis.1